MGAEPRVLLYRAETPQQRIERREQLFKLDGLLAFLEEFNLDGHAEEPVPLRLALWHARLSGEPSLASRLMTGAQMHDAVLRLQEPHIRRHLKTPRSAVHSVGKLRRQQAAMERLSTGMKPPPPPAPVVLERIRRVAASSQSIAPRQAPGRRLLLPLPAPEPQELARRCSPGREGAPALPGTHTG